MLAPRDRSRHKACRIKSEVLRHVTRNPRASNDDKRCYRAPPEADVMGVTNQVAMGLATPFFFSSMRQAETLVCPRTSANPYHIWTVVMLSIRQSESFRRGRASAA